MSSTTSDAKIAGLPRVVIIGAGVAGISMAVAIKNQLKHDSFTIYEREDAVGGTWRDNTYPGCGSDIPGHWYSLSTELNPNWSSYFVEQPEIRAYWDNVWKKHSLDSHTIFNTSVRYSEWDNTAKVWRCTLVNNKTSEESMIEAELLVNAIGGFMSPNFPKDVPGKDSFNGPVFHSARWRHDVELRNKRVAVIGNGCSAAQFIPKISEDSSVEVVNFCRTAQWYIPRLQYSYHAVLKWIFKHIPGVMRTYRNFIMAKSDLRYPLFRKQPNAIGGIAKTRMIKYIKSKAPREYHGTLIPNYSPGCKRIIVDPDYLESLHRNNVSLNWDGIDSIIESGIRMKSGEILPFDVIIFGTGFSLDAKEITTRGRNGMTLDEWNAAHNGATAYKGTCIPGFPNFFIVFGPNVATGHTSVIFSNEIQTSLIIQLMKPVLQGKVKTYEVTEEASGEYNDWLQKRLDATVWTECSSFYRTGMNGKNTVIFPGPSTLFWYIARNPVWGHFISEKTQPNSHAPTTMPIWSSRFFAANIAVVTLLSYFASYILP